MKKRYLKVICLLLMVMMVQAFFPGTIITHAAYTCGNLPLNSGLVYDCNNSPLNAGGTVCSPYSGRICNVCNGNYASCPHASGVTYGGIVCSPSGGICNVCHTSYATCPHVSGQTYGGTVCSPYTGSICNICNRNYSGCPHVSGQTYGGTYHVHTSSCPSHYTTHVHTSSCPQTSGIPEPDPSWSTPKKIQYYLDYMGFTTGGVDGIFGIKSSSALIMLQYYHGSSYVTGKPDSTSYDLVKSDANNSKTYSIVKSYINNNWSPGSPTISKTTSTNGYLPTSSMVRVPTTSYADAYLEKQAAISWAIMVDAAMQNSSVNVNKLGAMGTASGYRSYHEQIEAYINYRHGGNIAALPYFTKGTTLDACTRSSASNANNTYAEAWIQSNWSNYTNDGVWNDVPDSVTASGGDLFGYGGSNHGWGQALDMGLSGSGTTEHNWLVNNASSYGFVPYSAEYWHWDYNP